MDMDLLCVERLAGCRLASSDSVIYDDLRVLRNMLEEEMDCIPEGNYFGTTQKDIQPFMRKVVTTWMLEVCEEQNCFAQVFPLAVNFLDRFLCKCAISRQQLQLVGAVCLLLASKLRQCHALGIDLLCLYTDNSVLPKEMRDWEMLLLSKLGWNMVAVTGFDFIDHILERVSWGRDTPLIRQHALTLVSLCYTEPELMLTAPSLLATASICAAVRGLRPSWGGAALADVCALVGTLADDVERVVRHVEVTLAAEAASAPTPAPAAAPGKAPAATATASATLPGAGAKYLEAPDDCRQPETPTDVTDVHF